MTKRKKKKKT